MMDPLEESPEDDWGDPVQLETPPFHRQRPYRYPEDQGTAGTPLPHQAEPTRGRASVEERREEAYPLQPEPV